MILKLKLIQQMIILFTLEVSIGLNQQMEVTIGIKCPIGMVNLQGLTLEHMPISMDSILDQIPRLTKQ